LGGLGVCGGTQGYKREGEDDSFHAYLFLGIVVVCLQIYELFSIRLVEDEKKIRKFVGLP
jgi:hypothetical protein